MALCEGIKRMEFEEKEQSLREFVLQNTEIKFSLGAVWTDRTVAADLLINSADKAMYEEKRSYYQKDRPCDGKL